jgi:glutamate-ammonia-ligase adenylyltransferase
LRGADGAAIAGAMTLSARISTAPLAFDPAIGAELAALYGAQGGPFRDLVAGAAGCSPFLAGLLRRERDWLAAAAAADPDATLDALIAGLPAGDAAALAAALRIARRRVALLVALADLGGVWDLDQVTGALTRFADAAVQQAVTTLTAAQIARGKIPGARAEDATAGAGLVVLAMGKMGAGELNYSSDIDLIVLFDEGRFDRDAYHDARAAFLRITRGLTALLSDVTGEGYVFRTDLRLRPDPSVTPVCLSMEAAERYYESAGRAWERAAFIKARPCAGDIATGQAFLERLRPFVWRRHLDYAAIQDAHDMRLRIRSHKGFAGPLKLEGHDIKLGRGGIREIEFFAQTRQLIAGGRDPALCDRRTRHALAALAARGWIPGAVAEALDAAYVAHRTTEHRLQMIHDSQTQTLPRSAPGFDRLARFEGTADTGAWRDALRDRLSATDATIERFFAPSETAAEPGPALSDAAQAIVARWPAYAALRSERATDLFERLRPRLLARFARSADPDAALGQFDGFLAGLPAGVQLFSLFDANPQLIDLLTDICAGAPGLAAYLARHPAVLDAVIAGEFFAPWPAVPALADDLAGALQRAGDYEGQLDAARAWMREWRFRIGVHHLRGLIDGPRAAAQYSDLAEAVLRGLWPVVVENFARRHGPPPGRGATVVAMGSLGARQMTISSDLDLIVIYDAAGAEGSTGRRPLAPTAYYARLTQALVTALTARMRAGQLYDVDMRLRPSGRQGPVATPWTGFQDYQRRDAWTWEIMALTRARAVAGADRLAADFEAFRRALLAERGDAERVIADAGAMRGRIAAATDAARLADPWEVKQGPGRIKDIELAAEAAALIAADTARTTPQQLRAGQKAGWPPPGDAPALIRAWGLFQRLNQALRLAVGGPEGVEKLGEAGRGFVLREAGADSVPALRERLADAQADAARRIDRLLPRTGSDE